VDQRLSAVASQAIWVTLAAPGFKPFGDEADGRHCEGQEQEEDERRFQRLKPRFQI
jgi:hypothetical protein